MNQYPSKWPALPLDHFPPECHQPHQLILITGRSGIGKTTYCQQWIASARAAGWQVGGLLAPPRIVAGQKVGIDLLDLASGDQRPYAHLHHASPHPTAPTTGRWQFDTAVLAWANAVLDDITAVDLLIIDELGPLEFEQGRGLHAAFDLLKTGSYRAGGVVVRPSLLASAQQRWPHARPLTPMRPAAQPQDTTP